MLKLEDVAFGSGAHDKITGAKGTVTAKCERLNGLHQVLLEGIVLADEASPENNPLDLIHLHVRRDGVYEAIN